MIQEMENLISININDAIKLEKEADYSATNIFTQLSFIFFNSQYIYDECIEKYEKAKNIYKYNCDTKSAIRCLEKILKYSNINKNMYDVIKSREELSVLYSDIDMNKSISYLLLNENYFVLNGKLDKLSDMYYKIANIYKNNNNDENYYIYLTKAINVLSKNIVKYNLKKYCKEMIIYCVDKKYINTAISYLHTILDNEEENFVNINFLYQLIILELYVLYNKNKFNEYQDVLNNHLLNDNMFINNIVSLCKARIENNVETFELYLNKLNSFNIPKSFITLLKNLGNDIYIDLYHEDDINLC